MDEDSKWLTPSSDAPKCDVDECIRRASDLDVDEHGKLTARCGDHRTSVEIRKQKQIGE